jgi:hypothetical protein
MFSLNETVRNASHNVAIHLAWDERGAAISSHWNFVPRKIPKTGNRDHDAGNP